MFKVTAPLKDILLFIQNSIPEEIFRKLCSKVSLVYPAQSITRADVIKLSDNLSCDVTQCQRAVDTIYFLFSKMSYHTTKPSAARSFLTPLLGADRSAIVAEVWEGSAGDILGRLKRPAAERTFTWGSSVTVSRDECARVAELEATLQVRVDDKLRNINFDYESLVRFHNELERVQSAIDHLA